MKPSYEFCRRCEKIAVDQRRLLNRSPYDPLRGEELAQWHGVQLREPNTMPGDAREAATIVVAQSDWDAVLLPSLPNDVRIILLRPHVSPARRQSTIMHEIAHLLLGHDPLAWNEQTGGFETRRKADETEAAYLGGCLQIPEVALRWAVQSYLTIGRTASHFGASERMVRYRADITRMSLRR
ncbi:MAG: ImmA/IrrE family metallo-endopeptidase [Armatimonadota bacterium]